MPPFHPFPGIRYAPSFDLANVTAPPYDIIDANGRAVLAARSERNVVVLDLPVGSDDRYARAAATFDSWRADDILVTDHGPTYTVYRMDARDEAGRPTRTLGVIGALALSGPDEGQILPHEHTTKKAKTDRLDLLRATCANLSPVWVLSLAEGLTALLETDSPPDAQWSDDDDVTHAVWCVDDRGRLDAISAAVASEPVVVADGHHRYETALVHRDERRAAAGPDADLGSDLLMAFVVEATEDELDVGPIHRLVDGPSAPELLAALGRSSFDILEPAVAADEVADGTVAQLMVECEALGLVTPDGSATLLRPRREAFADVADLDSARVAHALAKVEGAEGRDQHGAVLVQQAVVNGEAAAGLLLRPATVAHIQANARSGERMPAKTTFFRPKPRTGAVFRLC